MADHNDNALSQSELEAETAEGLPERAAMSTIPPLPGTDALELGGLLDLDVNVDLTADAAAPIGAAIAANANVAAPIDAAVAANVASPDATAAAAATQNSTIIQDLDGTATAETNQTSGIEQGEGDGDATADAGGGGSTP